VLAAIESKKTMGLAQFIGALGIRHVGEVTAGLLAQHFTDLHQLMASGKEKFVQIEGIGEQTAESLAEYFHDPTTRQMVEQLFHLGLVFQAQEKSKALLTGRVFLFTGTLQSLSRDEAKQVVKAQGGQVASSISHRVTDVVVGEKAGSKRKKAEEMGLALLPEEAFLSLIERGHPDESKTRGGNCARPGARGSLS